MKNFIIILIVLLFIVVPVSAKQEVYVLYDSITGRISGGTGRVNRIKDETRRDGSTVLEYIERKMAEGKSVLYLPNSKLPDPEKQKVSAGKVVDMTVQEIVDREAARPKTKLQLLEERIEALEKK